MKTLRFLVIACSYLTLFAALSAADSLALRNGRRLQGKYLGGTTTTLGFMTGGAIEYFATADVLVLIFDNNTDSPLTGLQPNPMMAHPVSEDSSVRVQRTSASYRGPRRRQLHYASPSRPENNLHEAPQTAAGGSL